MMLLDGLGLSDIQRVAATTRGRDISLIAGAGSGKTRTLVARFLALLDDGLSPTEVAAVTFTEKAAREMRNRIRQAIHNWLHEGCPPEAQARWADIESDVDAARIGTIHSLCAALLRAHPAEAAVDPRFEVLDEGQAAVLRIQAVDDSLAWLSGQPSMVPLLAAFGVADLGGVLSQLLETRVDAQAALAGHDAGLWRLLICQALAAFAEDRQVQAAIAALRGLAEDGHLEADAGDKLAAHVLGLLNEWSRFEQALADGRGTEAAAALFNVRRRYSGGSAGKQGNAKAAVKALRDCYDGRLDPWLGGKNARSEAPGPERDAAAAALLPLLTVLFERASREYERAKDVRQALDFDDLEAGAVALLARAEVRARWQQQVRALLVDEFQDTNERQRRIIEALAGTHDGLSGRLFVVGDARQSIYRFRGADVEVFRQLDADIAARGGLPLSLNETYRAHANLLDALNELLAAVHANTPAEVAALAVPFAPLIAKRRQPRGATRPPHIEVICGLGEDGSASAAEGRPASAWALARRLHELRAEGQLEWDDVAVLFRASGAVPVYEAALEAARIPFVTVAGRGFHDRPEVRDLLNMLRALADPWDDLALAGMLRSPAIGLSDAALYRLRWPEAGGAPASLKLTLSSDLDGWPEPERQRLERARNILERLAGLADRVPVAELLKHLLDETLYPALLVIGEHSARAQRNVEKLLADAHASGRMSVAAFLEYIGTLQAAGAREGEAPAEASGSLRLMTVHKAKGLEFPVVVVADAAREPRAVNAAALLSGQAGLVPNPGRLGAPLIYRWARQGEAARDAAEDLRVLYVAATRAQEKLILCGHMPRRGYSSWLDRLADAAGVDLDAAAGQPGLPVSITLPVSGQQVAAFVYRPPAEPTADEPAPPGAAAGLVTATETPPGAEQPLLGDAGAGPAASLAQPPMSDVEPALDADSVPEGRPFAVWTRRRAREHDGTLVGSLVHAALAHWRFPGDPALSALLRATLLERGIVGGEQHGALAATAERLLERLRADRRWPGLDAAERRHEVAFSLPGDGHATGGVIDLLYRQAGDSAWRLIEFKTDVVDAATGLPAEVEAAHAAQVQAYAQAVGRLLGQPPASDLCYLDWGGRVRWVGVRTYDKE
jgi:ATP-dependent helicase/nuclease subunit A